MALDAEALAQVLPRKVPIVDHITRSSPVETAMSLFLEPISSVFVPDFSSGLCMVSDCEWYHEFVLVP